jgi:hypothetical protein
MQTQFKRMAPDVCRQQHAQNRQKVAREAFVY